MHVLHVIGNTVYGGAEVYLRTLLNEWDDSTLRCTVVCAYKSQLSDWLEAQHKKNYIVPMTYWPMGPDDVGSAVASLVDIIREGEYDVVHSHLLPADICTGLACSLVGFRPIVSTAHETKVYPSQSRIGKILGTRFICVCAAVQKQLITAGVPADRTELIYNGVDLDRFYPRPAPTQLRKTLGIPKNSTLFVTLTRLSPEKNLSLLLKAAAIAVKEMPTLSWLIAGDGPEEGELKNLARELKLRDHIIFIPSVHNTPEVLNSSDVHVLCSSREGFPYATMEAMACGLPVIVTNVGGNIEAVVDGETGHIVPSNDIPALAEAMIKMAREPSQRNRMGRNARLRAEKLFASSRMARSTYELYKRILEE